MSLLLAHDIPTAPTMQTTRADLTDRCISKAAGGAAWFLIVACLIEAVIFLGLAQTVHKRSRSFHFFSYVMMLIPVIAYVALLSGVGLTDIGAPNGDRCFFTARWLMLALEYPLLVTSCGLLAGVAAFDLSIVAIASFLTVAAGGIGGMLDGNNRWILFLVAVCCAIPVLRAMWDRFHLKEGDFTGYEHEYAGVVANRLAFVCTIVFLYIFTTVIMWALCQGGGIVNSSTELLLLAIVDIVFISAFCIVLISDRETIEKMAEYNARSTGWSLKSQPDYSSIEERHGAGVGKTTPTGTTGGARF